MNGTELDEIAARMSERILSAVQIAERLKGLEVQSTRNAADIESEKGTRARENERTRQTLETMQNSIQALSKSNWTAAGAIAAGFVLWDVAKHFIKF